MKKGALRNFAKFTRKHLCHILFFNKVVDLRPLTLFKKRLWHLCFPVNFAKFLRTPFLQNTTGQLLLHFVKNLIKARHVKVCNWYPDNSKSNVKLFADNTFLFAIVKDKNESANTLNNDLMLISNVSTNIWNLKGKSTSTITEKFLKWYIKILRIAHRYYLTLVPSKCPKVLIRKLIIK